MNHPKKNNVNRLNKTVLLVLSVLFVLFFIPTKSYARAQIIKLATLAPKGSQWYNALMEATQELQKASNGKIKFRIYPGGVAGDAPVMIRKMRIGQLQGAALTSSGMAYVYPDMTALTFPNNIKTENELKYVLKKVGPYFEKEVYKKGFKILNWNNAGWVHFFSKTPVITPNDMKKQKLFFWGSEARYVELLKNSGFHPVPLSLTDLLPGLQTGLVTAFAASPTAALAFQWYSHAPNMCGLRWQPLPAMVVITKKAWEKIPKDIQPILEKSMKKLSAKLWMNSMKIENDAIKAMKKHGLKVHPLTPSAKAEWQKLIKDKAYPLFVGHRFSKEAFEKIQAALKEYRKK